jgi:hypothetical protein
MIQNFFKLFRRVLFFGSLFLFIFTTYAIGATYYVDPNGSNSNPGTQSKPWAHPQKCADTMVGGDTCIVNDGIYSDNDADGHVVETPSSFRGADADHWVTFQAANKHGAVLDGKNSSVYGRGFAIQYTSYVKIIGFEIKRVYTGIKMYNSAHDIYIETCKIHDIGRHWADTECHSTAVRNYAGIEGRYDTWSITVKNCNLYNIGRAHNIPEGSCWRDYLYDHAIYASGKLWTIENCEFRDIHSGWHVKICGHDGATSRPTHVIRNCKFYYGNGGSSCRKDVFWGQILLTKSHGDYKPHDVVIENCTFNKPEQNVAMRISDYINLQGSVFKNNVTTGGTLYIGGYNSPFMSDNMLNQDLTKDPGLASPSGLKIIVD